MKAVALFLAGSLAANAVLATVWYKRQLASGAGVAAPLPDVAKVVGPASASRTPPARPAGATVDRPANPWTWPATAGFGDIAAQLRAAGVPRDLLRVIIKAEIERRAVAQQRELAAKRYAGEYWRATTYRERVDYGAALSEIFLNRSKQVRKALAEAQLEEDASSGSSRRYGGIDATKAALVRQIEEDYAEIASQLRQSFQGITLAKDQEQLALLEREKQADIAAALTPEELADYRMRVSPITSRLRGAMTLMDASEAEFRRIYQIYEAQPTPGAGGTVTIGGVSDLRTTASNETPYPALRQEFGEARFAEFVRANNREYQHLRSIAAQENVPVEAANRAFALREQAASSSQRIAADATLTTEQKTAALTQLARDTRAQLAIFLGEKASAGYVKSATWVSTLEKGSPISFRPDGSLVRKRGGAR